MILIILHTLNAHNAYDMLNYSFEIVWSQVRLEFDCLINFCMTILRGGIPEHMLIIFDDFTLQKVAIDRKFPFI